VVRVLLCSCTCLQACLADSATLAELPCDVGSGCVLARVVGVNRSSSVLHVVLLSLTLQQAVQQALLCNQCSRKAFCHSLWACCHAVMPLIATAARLLLSWQATILAAGVFGDSARCV
jgi:hypothetical protein